MPNKFTQWFKGEKATEDGEQHRQQEEHNRRARDARERRVEITGRVRENLWSALKNGRSGPRRFVCFDDLNRIWDSTQIIEPLAEGLDWCDQASLAQAKENFLRVMSTLVWIGWDKWEEFGYLFIHNVDATGQRNRNDDNLPLKDTTFLHTEPFRISFKDEQHIFKPELVVEDDPEEDSGYVKYSERDRLPLVFIEHIGRGGAGTVTKEGIPPTCFLFKNGSLNTKPMYVARKRFPGAGVSNRDFEIEQKNLRLFKKCLNQNGNIMQSYTAFLHGSDFNIISPLADLDLHTYFEGSYSDFSHRSRCFSPADLLYGASCLAGALRFLHEGLQPVSFAEKIYCAHLDLKPENILVIWPKGPDPPAGRWLVHDFGTSKIKESRNARSSKSLVAPGDFIRQFSLTQASRTPGPFQAPEVQNSTERVVGTESDIWSLGCILAQVLTFALGGPAFVSQLAQSTYEGFSDDYFYNAADENYALKGPVVQYLNSLTSSFRDNYWIVETLGLIYKILVKDPRSRPSAKEVQDTLERACRTQEASLREHCPWAYQNSQLSRHVTTSRIEQSRQSAQRHPQPQPQPLPQPLPPPLAQPQTHRPLESNQGRQREMPEIIPHFIVRPPTTVNGSFDEQPGLEVIASPVSSPISDSLSHFDTESINNSRMRQPSLSRSSSTSTRPVSLTEDVSFIRLYVQKATFKSIICPGSCHVAFISKKQTSIMRILDNDWTKNQKGPVISAGYLQTCTKDNPDSFEWVDGCMSGSYIVLRAKRTNGRESKVYRYKCDDTGHIWSEEPIVDTVNSTSTALDATVSKWGDIVFICDDRLLYYSTQYGFYHLATTGRHRIGSVRFSPDGLWVFGWSHDAGINHFYKWDTRHHLRSQTDNSRTLKRIWHIKEQTKSPERAGFGNPAIYPFSNYFVAFDRPDRVLTVGKPDSNLLAIQVQRDVRDIIGGTSLQGTLLNRKIESLVLLQNHSGLLMTFPMTQQGAGKPSEGLKLKLKFNADSDALALFSTGSDFYIVVSHSDGRLERRRVSTT